jgi:hypothetical protein
MLIILEKVYGLDKELILSHGFFQGYTIWTWFTILDQAAGGLIVAVVVRYTSSVDIV